MEIEERKEEEIIKGECLLSGKVTSKRIEDNIHEIIIKKDGNNQIYLSDVLDRLPYGLVSKEETGMGATSLELQTPRNSIIVEPIKITASSKAYSHTKSPTDKVLYVGSETKFHQKKITKAEIVAYVNNPKIKHKKIIVVADSLYRVVDAIGDKVFKDYFLLLDEVDSFQMDSIFRKSMEECIQYYKKFEKPNRCMLSATLIDFSDPDLNKEGKTVIMYDKISPRKIHIIRSNTPELIGNTADKITELLNDYPDEKIMVAFNSVARSFEVAEYLNTTGIVSENDLKILCSKASKDKVRKYYSELDSELLPGKVNFVTSAYFSGFDLKEDYHLISVSSNKNKGRSLSDKRLKQIAGRCRTPNSIISETVVYDLANIEADYVLPNKESLIADAQTQIDSLKCIERHYSKSPLLKRIRQVLVDQIIETLENKKSRFVKKNTKTNNVEISYLNIDAYLENSITHFELYKEKDQLFNKLVSQRHKVSREFRTSTTLVPKIDVDKQDREVKLKELIAVLRTHPDDSQLQILLAGDILNDYQKKIVEQYRKLSYYIDVDNLIDRIEEAGGSDSRALNNLFRSANYSILATGNNYKSRMLKYFPIGSKLSADEIIFRLNSYQTDCQFSFDFDTIVKAIRFLNTYLYVSKKNRKDGKYLIKGENPYNLKINKLTPEIEDMKSPFLPFMIF